MLRSDFERLFHLKRSTANDRLARLVTQRILKPEGNNRNRRYVLA